jgi:hypothetical protein
VVGFAHPSNQFIEAGPNLFEDHTTAVDAQFAARQEVAMRDQFLKKHLFRCDFDCGRHFPSR